MIDPVFWKSFPLMLILILKTNFSRIDPSTLNVRLCLPINIIKVLMQIFVKLFKQHLPTSPNGKYCMHTILTHDYNLHNKITAARLLNKPDTRVAFHGRMYRVRLRTKVSVGHIRTNAAASPLCSSWFS